MFTVPGKVQWHAMSCIDPQEQQEILSHTNTLSAAGILFLLVSLVSPSVLAPCRHGCHSTAHCCVTWPVKKPYGLEQ